MNLLFIFLHNLCGHSAPEFYSLPFQALNYPTISLLQTQILLIAKTYAELGMSIQIATYTGTS